MAEPTGRRLPLSVGRKYVIDIMREAKRVPSLPLAKTIDVTALVAARRECGASPSWLALFAKAYGLTAVRRPELRRAYIRWPLAHFYEHPQTIAGVLVEREHEGENLVLVGKLRAPENQSLVDLNEHIRAIQTVPVWEKAYFRQQLRLANSPSWLRRYGFWRTLHWSGALRARHCGTFSISSLGSLGVEQMHPLTVLTTYLTFGPIDAAGRVNVKIVYDHRVMDGRCVARCLNDVEEILAGEILNEVRRLTPNRYSLQAA